MARLWDPSSRNICFLLLHWYLWFPDQLAGSLCSGCWCSSPWKRTGNLSRRLHSVWFGWSTTCVAHDPQAQVRYRVPWTKSRRPSWLHASTRHIPRSWKPRALEEWCPQTAAQELIFLWLIWSWTHRTLSLKGIDEQVFWHYVMREISALPRWVVIQQYRCLFRSCGYDNSAIARDLSTDVCLHEVRRLKTRWCFFSGMIQCTSLSGSSGWSSNPAEHLYNQGLLRIWWRHPRIGKHTFSKFFWRITYAIPRVCSPGPVCW